MARPKKTILDPMHYHEISDRILMAISIIDREILNHQVCIQEDELKTLLEQSCLSLIDGYKLSIKLAHDKFKPLPIEKSTEGVLEENTNVEQAN